MIIGIVHPNCNSTSCLNNDQKVETGGKNAEIVERDSYCMIPLFHSLNNEVLACNFKFLHTIKSYDQKLSTWEENKESCTPSVTFTLY